MFTLLKQYKNFAVKTNWFIGDHLKFDLFAYTTQTHCYFLLFVVNSFKVANKTKFLASKKDTFAFKIFVCAHAHWVNIIDEWAPGNHPIKKS